MRDNDYSLYRIRPRLELSYKKIMGIGNLDPYNQHQAMWKLFNLPRQEKKEKADFLFRFDIDKKNKLPVFFLLSSKGPLNDREGLWEIESKHYDPDIRTGDRLSFKLRANPVVKKKPLEPDPNPKKRKRHDVVMEAKTRFKNDNIPRKEWPSINEIIHQASVEWLKNRSDNNGFTFIDNDKISEIQATGYQAYKFNKKGKRINFSSVDFDGSLTVTNADLFKKTLFEGLGPSKAFGCGLMLVRRI